MATLLHYLHQLKQRGEHYLSLNQSSKQILRQIFIANKQPSSQAKAMITEKTAQPSAITKTLPTDTTSATKTTNTSIASTSKATSQQHKVTAKQPTGNGLLLSANTPLALHDLYHQQWQTVQQHTVSQQFYPSFIAGQGPINPKIMWIHDYPGYFEIKLQQAFAGEKAKKLLAIYQAMQLDNADCYTTNYVKMRPFSAMQTIETRPPNKDESAIFNQLLLAEITAVKPQVIVTSSIEVTQLLAPNLAENELAKAIKNNSLLYQQSPIIVVPHIQLLLLPDSHQFKYQLWQKMLSIMAYLKIPISAKQKNYFS